VCYDTLHALCHSRTGIALIDTSLLVSGARYRHLTHHTTGKSFGVSTGLCDAMFGSLPPERGKE
jgi:hypothetical protein